MNYTLDCEFNGYQGQLLSLALYTPERPSLYMVDVETVVQLVQTRQLQPWVRDHVLPLLQHKDLANTQVVMATREHLQQALQEYLRDQTNVRIHADWPDDIKYFCELLLTGPGQRLPMVNLTFELAWVDAYDHEPEQALRHHAWRDAQVLYQYLFAK